MANGGCPRSEHIQAQAEGAVDPGIRAEALRHLEGCADCKRFVERSGAPTQDVAAPVRVPSERSELGTQEVKIEPPVFSTMGVKTPAASGKREALPLLTRGSAVGKYLVLDVLGQGGMGVVYSAVDPELTRKVALKLVRTDSGGSGSQQRETESRVLREAQALAKLSHPNVVTVFELGTFERQVFIAMELVVGKTVRQWTTTQFRTWREIVDIYAHAGEGLAAAHRAGIVHRDFKPDNVMVGDDGRVRVMDFGVARGADADTELEVTFEPESENADLRAGTDAPTERNETSSAPSSSPSSSSSLSSSSGQRGIHVTLGRSSLEERLTQVGSVVGTLPYLAPEQLQGNRGDAKTDQFAFGVALFESLYDQRPFRKTAIGTLDEERWTVTEPPPNNKQVPPSLRKTVLRALSKKPEDRFPSMEALLSELRRSPAAGRWKWMASAVVLAAAVSAGVLYHRAERSRRCDGVTAASAGVWNTEQREAAKSAFLAAKTPWAEAAFRSVDTALGDYVSQWRSLREEACFSTRVRGEQNEATMALMSTCLAERLEGARVLADTFAKADADVTRRASEAIRQLRPLQACANPAYLHTRLKPPDTDEVTEKVALERQQLAGARALLSAGQFDASARVLDEVASRIGALKYAPLEAELSTLRGRVADARGQDTAPDELKQGLQSALRTDHDEVSAEAALALMRWNSDLGRYPEAGRWSFFADVFAQRRPAGDPALGDFLEAQSRWFTEQDRLEEALVSAKQSLEAREREKPVRLLAVASSYQRLCHVYSRLPAPNVPAAIAAGRKALEIREKELGPRHPEVAYASGNLAIALGLAGEDEASEAFHRRTFDIIEATYGSQHPFWARAAINVAEVLQLLERHADAEALATRTIETFGDRAGTDHELREEVADAHSIRAGSRVAAGDFKGALADARRSIALFEAALSPRTARLVRPLYWAAEAELGLKHPKEARALLERAVALPERLSIQPVYLSLTHFALAKALRTLGGPATSVRAEAERALALLREQHATRAAAIRAWLETLPREVPTKAKSSEPLP